MGKIEAINITNISEENTFYVNQAILEKGKGIVNDRYYENFKRACRKGTPAEEFGVKGQDTLTKAQKYTARELSNARANSGTSQYYAPQASNILFRFKLINCAGKLRFAF